MKIKRIAPMLAILVLAIFMLAYAMPAWASVGEDDYDGLPRRGRDIIYSTDGCDASDIDGDYDCDYTNGHDYSTAVAVVNVNGAGNGMTHISIAGHADIEFIAFATYYEMEFFVMPPEGTHFTPETSLAVSGGVQVTFGPVVRGCGRLFFVISAYYGESDNNTGTDIGNNVSEAVSTVDIIFDPGNGLLPYGESGSLSGPAVLLVANGPTPYAPGGFDFAGWQHNGVNITFPFHAAASMTLNAVYEPRQANTDTATVYSVTQNANTTAASEESQGETVPEATTFDMYAAVFDPTPGAFASGETGLRSGAYGTYISNIPVPTRNGYIFGGWRLPNGNTLSGNLNLRGDIALEAIWSADPTVTPSPSPSPSPNPSATPAPGNTGTLPNPQTSPIRVSLMIFGTVAIAGITALGIMKVGRKHMADASEYRVKMARYNREKRIAGLMDDMK